jgi:hypothetical protein
MISVLYNRSELGSERDYNIHMIFNGDGQSIDTKGAAEPHQNLGGKIIPL